MTYMQCGEEPCHPDSRLIARFLDRHNDELSSSRCAATGGNASSEAFLRLYFVLRFPGGDMAGEEVLWGLARVSPA